MDINCTNTYDVYRQTLIDRPTLVIQTTWN